mmetsp:Transcript_15108/g.20849  ORF Transcript_15108/g.20849 Transcript_15108/m.20849 type:complete len:408 (-) Transcript_15108:167-1390(-)
MVMTVSYGHSDIILNKYIANHYFNFSLDLILPSNSEHSAQGSVGSRALNQDETSTGFDYSSFHTAQLSLLDLLEKFPYFLERKEKSGKIKEQPGTEVQLDHESAEVNVQSQDQHVGATQQSAGLDVKCVRVEGQVGRGRSLAAISVFTSSEHLKVTPDGRLHMCLTKYSLEKLGVQGTTVPGDKNYCNATVNLSSLSLKAGGSRREQLVRAWRRHGSTRPLDVVFYYPQQCSDPAQAPSSLPFQSAQHHSLSYSTRVMSKIYTPDFSKICSPNLGASNTQTLCALHEWLGWVLCAPTDIPTTELALLWAAEMDAGMDADENGALSCSSVNCDLEHHSWKGLVKPKKVLDCVKKCRVWIENDVVPWAIIHVGEISSNHIDSRFTPPLCVQNYFSIVMLPSNQHIRFTV